MNFGEKPTRSLILSSSEHELELLVEQVKCWGFDVCATRCSNEAEGVVRALSDLDLLLDVIILEHDVISSSLNNFINNIKQHSCAAQTPIVAIGSSAFLADVSENSDINCAAALPMPCAPSLLEKTVTDVLSGKIAKTEPVEEQTVTHSFGLDVLIAEDNEVNQIVFTQVLEDMGVKYKIANNGQEAIDLWVEHNPAMIMMDVSMPVMNGHEATKEIRRREEIKGTHTPICAITAHALKGDMEDCLNAGMDDYLSKPISPDIMIAKIHDMLPSGHPLGKVKEQQAA